MTSVDSAFYDVQSCRLHHGDEMGRYGVTWDRNYERYVCVCEANTNQSDDERKAVRSEQYEGQQSIIHRVWFWWKNARGRESRAPNGRSGLAHMRRWPKPTRDTKVWGRHANDDRRTLRTTTKLRIIGRLHNTRQSVPPSSGYSSPLRYFQFVKTNQTAAQYKTVTGMVEQRLAGCCAPHAYRLTRQPRCPRASIWRWLRVSGDASGPASRCLPKWTGHGDGVTPRGRRTILPSKQRWRWRTVFGNVVSYGSVTRKLFVSTLSRIH